MLSEQTRLRFQRRKLLVLKMLIRMYSRQNAVIMLRHFENEYVSRRAWCLDRPHSEFEQYFLRRNPDLGYWKANFRMSRETFEYVRKHVRVIINSG